MTDIRHILIDAIDADPTAFVYEHVPASDADVWADADGADADADVPAVADFVPANTPA